MWVKLTLPPWRRRRCPLRTLRLTSSSRAGTVRTEVAVGTSRLASIASTIRAAAPRSGTSSGSALPSPSAAGLPWAPACPGLGGRLGCRPGPSGGSRPPAPWLAAPPGGRGAAAAVGAGRPRPRPGPRPSPRPPPRRRRPGARSRRRSPARRGSPTPGCPGTGGRSRRSAQRWRRTPVVRTNPSAAPPLARDLVGSSLPPMPHPLPAASRASGRDRWCLSRRRAARATMLVPARMASSSKASLPRWDQPGSLRIRARLPAAWNCCGCSSTSRTHRSAEHPPVDGSDRWRPPSASRTRWPRGRPRKRDIATNVKRVERAGFARRAEKGRERSSGS